MPQGFRFRFFPVHHILDTGNDFIAANKKSREKTDHNLLLLVYTKKDIPFYAIPTCANILNWLNNIEPDEREVVYEDFFISE